MRILTGGMEVLSSGTVISYQNEPISFILAEGNPPLEVSFVFASDATPDKPRVDSRTDGNKKLTIQLFNFNNALGTGSTEPISIGTLNSRKLRLNYRVYYIGENSARSLQYTWYLGETVNG